MTSLTKQLLNVHYKRFNVSFKQSHEKLRMIPPIRIKELGVSGEPSDGYASKTKVHKYIENKKVHERENRNSEKEVLLLSNEKSSSSGVQKVDSSTLFCYLQKWWDGSQTEEKIQTYTIYGESGSGKGFVCNLFANYLTKAFPKLRLLWLDSLDTVNNQQPQAYEDVLKPLEDLPDVNSNLEYLIIFPITCDPLYNIPTTIFEELHKRKGQKNLRVIFLTTVDFRTKMNYNHAALQNLSFTHCKQIVQSVNSSITEEAILVLCEKFRSKPSLLKLAASLVTMKRPTFGNKPTYFLKDLTRFADENSFVLCSGRFNFTTVILEYTWDYLAVQHRVGKFAQIVLIWSVHCQTWLPVDVIQSLKYPSSIYTTAHAAHEDPKSKLVFYLLKHLGLLYFNVRQDMVRIPNSMKVFIDSPAASKSEFTDKVFLEFILLNMRFTENFVSILRNPISIIKKAVLSNFDIHCDHIMAIIRNPLSREIIAKKMRLPVREMLLDLQIEICSIQKNEAIMIEIDWLSLQHEYLSSKRSMPEMRESWLNTRSKLKPNNVVFFKITESLSFILGESPEAQYYFDFLLEHGQQTVVDEETLNHLKNYLRFCKNRFEDSSGFHGKNQV